MHEHEEVDRGGFVSHIAPLHHTSKAYEPLLHFDEDDKVDEINAYQKEQEATAASMLDAATDAANKAEKVLKRARRKLLEQLSVRTAKLGVR